jgi:hypothetical protein
MNFNLRRFVSPKVGAAIALSPVLLAPMASHAVFTVPTEITDAATNVGLVGAAVFAIMVGIKLYKWLRRAL